MLVSLIYKFIGTLSRPLKGRRGRLEEPGRRHAKEEGRRKAPSERSYARITRHERQAIERILDRGKGAREMTRERGRASSTAANEVMRHRFVTAPKAMYGEPAPVNLSGACERLKS